MANFSAPHAARKGWKSTPLPRTNQKADHPAIRAALLGWFRRSARPLPWRRTKNPYAVWVSEIMLQQTQIATVIPYYQRFLKRFPTLKHLARGPLERVLKLWSGLGYYRRARYLLQAAQVISSKFGGQFPQDYDQARSLPGIGDYTARAVLSIAYQLPYFVLDGNVARVIARLAALGGNLSQASFRRAVERELGALLSQRQPGDFNQALMELGQTVCLPRSPRCGVCPLRQHCRAHRLGKPESYPGPRPRRPAELRYLASAVLRQGSKLALVRGLDDGLMTDLWNFPSAFGRSRREALGLLQEKLQATLRGPVGLGGTLAELNHRITFRSIRVHVYAAESTGKTAGKTCRWLSREPLAGAAISQLARKIAAAVSQPCLRN